MKLSYDGGLDSELSAKGETKNKNSFDSSGSMKKKVDRVVTELAIVNEALIDVAYIGDLTAGNIKFDTASGNIMDLQTLLAKFVTGENGQYLNLTGTNTVFANSIIKDAMIESVNAGKIKTGTLDTNLVTIQGPSGNLLIKDNTIQIKDSTRVRVQIGKDASNDYNMYVWDSSGKLMFDATGLKADGIKSKIIRDDMVSDNANINGSKLNISSLITEVNKDNTQTLKASKIAFDSTGQSLEVSFNTLKSNVDGKETRNLFRNSFNEYKDIGIGQYLMSIGLRKHCSEYGLVVGDKITFSLDIKSTSNKPLRARVDFYSEPSGDIGKTTNSSTIIVPAGGEGKSYITVVIPKDKEYIQLMLANADTTITTNTVEKYKCAKLEKGENPNPVWSPAPEDIEEKIESNTTAITVVQGKIEGLIKESSITKGDVTTLKDNYTSIKATVDGINTTVASHTSSIGNLTADLSGVSGKVATVETKQATLEQNLNGFKTTVSNTYSTKTELNTVKGTVTSVEQRINTVEQKVTATAITTTISSAINAGTSSITTTQFVMDKTGFTVKNGAIKIQNKAGTNVMTSDTNGNLTITCTFVNKNYNGVDAIKIQDTSIYFYDWERNGRELGIIYSSYILVV